MKDALDASAFQSSNTRHARALMKVLAANTSGSSHAPSRQTRMLPLDVAHARRRRAV